MSCSSCKMFVALVMPGLEESEGMGVTGVVQAPQGRLSGQVGGLSEDGVRWGRI